MQKNTHSGIDSKMILLYNLIQRGSEAVGYFNEKENAYKVRRQTSRFSMLLRFSSLFARQCGSRLLHSCFSMVYTASIFLLVIFLSLFLLARDTVHGACVPIGIT